MDELSAGSSLTSKGPWIWRGRGGRAEAAMGAGMPGPSPWAFQAKAGVRAAYPGGFRKASQPGMEFPSALPW